jgi:hypothetical protein
MTGVKLDRRSSGPRKQAKARFSECRRSSNGTKLHPALLAAKASRCAPLLQYPGSCTKAAPSAAVRHFF